MKTPPPIAVEIERLLAFLPRLSVAGFTPIRRWGGGEKNANGAYVMPWPVYDEIVKAFFEEASKECWNDADYVPIEAGRMLDDEPRVRRASLDEIRTIAPGTDTSAFAFRLNPLDVHRFPGVDPPRPAKGRSRGFQRFPSPDPSA